MDGAASAVTTLTKQKRNTAAAGTAQWATNCDELEIRLLADVRITGGGGGGGGSDGGRWTSMCHEQMADCVNALTDA